ncbi:cytochrome C oxidase subunit IV family protein [bacterium]|nr:cytochrome C oxidase subunit IV family protein [bacterium]
MSNNHASENHTAEHHEHPNYKKVYITLLVLLAISVLGPMIGIKALTLITAFGIAIVKAYMVAANFMHLKFEKKYINYFILTCLALMIFFFFAIAPDIMKWEGRNWKGIRPEISHESINGHGHH